MHFTSAATGLAAFVALCPLVTASPFPGDHAGSPDNQPGPTNKCGQRVFSYIYGKYDISDCDKLITDIGNGAFTNGGENVRIDSYREVSHGTCAIAFKPPTGTFSYVGVNDAKDLVNSAIDDLNSHNAMAVQGTASFVSGENGEVPCDRSSPDDQVQVQYAVGEVNAVRKQFSN